MTMRDVAELVREDDADLSAGEAAVEQRVPDDDVRRRAEPARERVRLVRDVADLLDVHRRASHVFARARASATSARSVGPRRVRPELRRDSRRGTRTPPTARGRSARRSATNGRRTVRRAPSTTTTATSANTASNESERPRLDDPRHVVVRREPVPRLPPLRQRSRTAARRTRASRATSIATITPVPTRPSPIVRARVAAPGRRGRRGTMTFAATCSSPQQR